MRCGMFLAERIREVGESLGVINKGQAGGSPAFTLLW